MTDQILKAGDIRLTDLTLWSSDLSKQISVIDMFDSLEIIEDLFKPAMHGTLLITEGYNLGATFPIVGEEIITLKCFTPVFDTPIIKTFNVVGIREKFLSGPKKMTYVIEFVSAEMTVDLYSKVYEAYSGSVSDIVSRVFKKYFPKTHINIETTQNATALVSPSASPFKYLSMLAERSMDQNGSNNYLFYEDNQSFNFRSLSSLYSQTPKAVFKWSYGMNRTINDDGSTSANVNLQYANALDIHIPGLFNSIEKVMSGEFGHKIYEVDIFSKSVNITTYSYQNNFGDSYHVSANPVNTPTMNFKGIENAKVDVAILHSNYSDVMPLDQDGILALKRGPLITQSSFIKLELTTHGRTDLKIGDAVVLALGNYASSDSESVVANYALDKMYSGKYIISAIKHTIGRVTHETTMEVITDSYPEPIKILPFSKNNNA
jgi:hypothetical protein